jgi:hypothetical protein
MDSDPGILIRRRTLVNAFFGPGRIGGDINETLIRIEA